MATKLEAGKTIVQDNDFARFVRGRHPDLAEKIVTFYVPSTRRWVLGTWLIQDAGLVRELVSWEQGTSPDSEAVQTIDANLYPSIYMKSVKRVVDNLVARHRERVRKQFDRWAEQRRVDEFLTRRLRIDRPAGMPLVGF